MNKEDHLILDPLPIPPVIFAELTFCFEHELPIEELDEVMGLQAFEAVPYQKTRISPITKQKNPGYWTFRTKSIQTFNCDEIFSLVENLVSVHCNGIKNALTKYSMSEFLVTIYITSQQKGDYPSIRISPERMTFFSTWNICLDIIIDE